MLRLRNERKVENSQRHWRCNEGLEKKREMQGERTLKELRKDETDKDLSL